ncbi:MAG TPA: hypothetical protein VGL38_07180 [bacterium]|jgi:hypothetical protein
MKLWTVLVLAMLCTAQAFSEPAPRTPDTRPQGNLPSLNATSNIAPSHSLTPDLPITWSQGFLALVRSSAPNDTILNWDAGTVECPGVAYSVYLHPKNFGPEDITLCAPVEPESPVFSRLTDCECYNSLAPYQMSPCSLRIEFHPSSDGTFRDTMRIQTDSWNSYGGFVRIPVVGRRVSTPASPNVVISIQGDDARLIWNPVRLSSGGCPTSVPGYLVYYSPDNNGAYRLLSFTPDTSYVHTGVLISEGGLFYQVVAGPQP